MPANTMFSYGQRSKCADLSELTRLFYTFSDYFSIFISWPSNSTLSPSYNLRPLMVSVSPFTFTNPSWTASFASTPESTSPAAFSACPSLINSSLSRNFITVSYTHLKHPGYPFHDSGKRPFSRPPGSLFLNLLLIILRDFYLFSVNLRGCFSYLSYTCLLYTSYCEYVTLSGRPLSNRKNKNNI